MNTNALPSVSIVIPAFNEERYIADCLGSLQQLNYPADLLEIIVVDNGSADKTAEIARGFNVSVYVLPNVKVGAVRNFGVAKSRGDIIAFLDGDCMPAANWLLDAQEYMKANNCDVVGGTCLLRPNPSWVESAWVISDQPKDNPHGTLIGGSILLHKSVFQAVNGFDETLTAGEDSNLGHRLRNQGYTVHIAKCCAFVHLGYPRNLIEFARRQMWHASNYLTSRKKGKADLMFLFTVAFAVAALAFLIGVITGLYFLCLPIGFMPLVLTLNRARKARFITFRIHRYVQMYILDFTYLAGRLLGLLKSVMLYLKIIDDKKSHY